jgi:cytoskeleton protein RodZ
MDSGVGTVLREARNRRKVELSEVEAATKIRFRYLRAIEDEEWDVLPGGVYTRSFIRTYASFLGLDGERLVEDYRGEVEPWQRASVEQAQSGSQDGQGEASPGRFSAALAGLVVVAVIAVAVIAIVAIPGGGGGGGPVAQPSPGTATPGEAVEKVPPAAPVPGVTIRVAAAAEVWACLLDAKGEALVDGLILEAGAEEGPFHSGSFTVSFGNGEVKMLIDGREADIPATSSPIGFAIDPAGRLSKLDEAERPTCT